MGMIINVTIIKILEKTPAPAFFGCHVCSPLESKQIKI
jgi:hypothetical protein